MGLAERLIEAALQSYQVSEFPALYEQFTRWSELRPLAGRRIFDATPVFNNTIPKYAALAAAGAELTVGYGGLIDFDRKTCDFLRECGVKMVLNGSIRGGDFDVVCDCAGANAKLPSRFGAVELTRSGVPYYENSDRPVFLADGGKVKRIETKFGTGDGFRRALAQLGYADLSGKKVLLFGCGKVGSGIAMAVTAAGAALTVVDDRPVEPPPGSEIVKTGDRQRIEAEIASAWCVVSATGVKGALRGQFDPAKLIASGALIANMGVEDEYGPEIPPERALQGKSPLNFILAEPTRLRYIDPSLALDNYGVLELLAYEYAPGINPPPPELEEAILKGVCKNGVIAGELEQADFV